MNSFYLLKKNYNLYEKDGKPSFLLLAKMVFIYIMNKVAKKK